MKLVPYVLSNHSLHPNTFLQPTAMIEKVSWEVGCTLLLSKSLIQIEVGVRGEGSGGVRGYLAAPKKSESNWGGGSGGVRGYLKYQYCVEKNISMSLTRRKLIKKITDFFSETLPTLPHFLSISRKILGIFVIPRLEEEFWIKKYLHMNAVLSKARVTQ